MTQDPEVLQVPQVQPLLRGRVSLDPGAHRDHQGLQDFQDFQGGMVSREAKVKRETKVNQGFRDYQGTLAELVSKERRENRVLVYLGPLASLDLLDQLDHAVYLMGMMLWALDLETLTVILKSSEDLRGHLGLPVLLDLLDLT